MLKKQIEYINAVEERDLATLTALEELSSLSCKKIFERESALYLAAEKGYLEVVGFLIARIRRSHFIIDVGIALRKSIEQGHLDVVKYVIQFFPNELEDLTSFFELLATSYLPKSKILRHKNYGKSIEIKEYKGFFPLHTAVLKEDMEMIKFLVKYFNINTQDQEGWTALHYAISKEKFKIARFLIDIGAEVKIKNKRDYAALDLCNEMLKVKVLQIKQWPLLKDEYGKRLHFLAVQELYLLDELVLSTQKIHINNANIISDANQWKQFFLWGINRPENADPSEKVGFFDLKGLGLN